MWCIETKFPRRQKGNISCKSWLVVFICLRQTVTFWWLNQDHKLATWMDNELKSWTGNRHVLSIYRYCQCMRENCSGNSGWKVVSEIEGWNGAWCWYCYCCYCDIRLFWEVCLKSSKWNKRLVRPDADSEGCKLSLALNAKVI